MRGIYATAGWGIHDEWWMQVLAEVGVSATPVSLCRTCRNGNVSSISSMQELIEFARTTRVFAGGDRPVFAGPLPTVARPLVELGLTVIGISWGWDLDENPADIFIPSASNHWIRNLTGLVVDTDRGANEATLAGLSPSRVMASAWGIDLNEFSAQGPTMSRGDLGVPESATVLVSLRSHTQSHGVSDILHALALASTEREDLYLVLAGDGPLREQHRRISSELGLEDRVRFLGSVPEHSLPRLIRTADCTVIASRTDGTPVSMLQSLACGVPVLTPNRESFLPWQRDRGRFTFSNGNIFDLCRQLTRIRRLEEPDRGLTLTSEMMERADRRTFVRRLKGFLSQLVP